MTPLLRIALGLVSSIIAQGQADNAIVAFEVASIKPSDPNQTISFKRSGYHIATRGASLEWLICWAYDIHTDRLVNKPRWLESMRYDIVANGPWDRPLPRAVPGEVSGLQRMMQKLLADRFKLVLHVESREVAMDALVVAPGGLKVKLSDRPEIFGQNPFRVTAPGRLHGTEVSMDMLAKALSSQLGRSVRNETGIEGVFDFNLEWAPDTHSDGFETGASLFTAIREQLGLKLEARKGSARVFAIDSIEPLPTEN
jgi:uncharacterized protein (TIGR03435 family)